MASNSPNDVPPTPDSDDFVDEASDTLTLIELATDEELDKMMAERLAKCFALKLKRRRIEDARLVQLFPNTAPSPGGPPASRYELDHFTSCSRRSAALPLLEDSLVHAAALEDDDTDESSTGDFIPADSVDDFNSRQWLTYDGLVAQADLDMVRCGDMDIREIVPLRPFALSAEGWKLLGEFCLELIEDLGKVYLYLQESDARKECLYRAKWTMRYAKDVFEKEDGVLEAQEYQLAQQR